MARRSATVNGNHVNGDNHPPSTLAAQIVQNQTRHTTSRAVGETATFSELLNAILHDQNATQETDVNVNAQLISVVTQLGLAPLTLENPFADWPSLLSQAADSIVVIERTIRRQPGVLLIQLTADGPQLVLSLLASLISLCGLPNCKNLDVIGLITASIACLRSSVNFWQSAQTLVEVLQESVDDGLAALEAFSAPDVPLNIKLPPARSVGKLWPSAATSITMPHGSSTTIGESARALSVLLELSQISGLNVPWQRDVQDRLVYLLPNFKQQLDKIGLWSLSVERCLRFPQNWRLAKVLLQNAKTILPATTLQTELAKALMETLRTCEDLAKDHLLPVLREIGKAEIWANLHQDLKITVTTWLCRYDSEDPLPEQVVAMRNALQQDNAMTDGELQTAFQQLSLSHTCTGRRGRHRKRRKISIDEPIIKRNVNTEGAMELLTGIKSTDLAELPRIAPAKYSALQESEKCAAWQFLIDLAEHDPPTTCQAVSRLIQLPDIHDTKRARILSLLAVQACVQRSSDAEFVALAMSGMGRHCMQSLQSSVREIRIAAGQVLACFLRKDLPEDIRSSNRHFALEIVRNLSDRDVAHEQETLIAAWGQIAISCSERELNLVLLRLVDYLGHGNMLVCALAFSEIETIAAYRKQTAKELFNPFWRSIAVAVVRDLSSRPQKAQQLCDLLGTDINTFLVNTQWHVLPTLVLTRRREILERIALARGKGESVRDICLQPITNLAPILTLLLTQSSADLEESAMACMIDIDPAFKDSDLAGLIKIDAGLVAAELLKLCGDQDESGKSRAYRAFQMFASIAQASPGQRRHSAKSSRAVASFFDSHILGILTHYSAILEETGPAATSIEKTRCLKGIAELFTLSRGNVSVALPQIRACLQTGLEQPQLCETAFSAWLTLMPLLQADDIVNIVDETFVLVIRHWAALSPETQHKTHEMISQLVKTHNSILQENIMTLPSLKGITVLSKFAAEFDRLKNQESPESHCKAFSRRLRVDGDAVVLQALAELVLYLEENQDFIHDTAASEHPSSVLSDLISALLDVTLKYSVQDPEAAQLCGKALGIIGSVDPNRVEANRRKRQLLVLSNFDDAGETIDWVMALFEDVLVKSFKSVTNARDQGFLAYTMQELLQICNFGELSTLRPRSSQIPDAYHRWDRLPEHVRTTLTPFLTSRYRVTSNSQVKDQSRVYPSFSPDASHGQWLRYLTIDLMQKAKGDNAKTIFPLLARTIKGHDLATARFVFPFVVLNVVVGGTVSEIQGLTEEFLAVLTATSASPSQQECIRLCSEAVFAVLDYFSTWLSEKRKALSELRTAAYKTGISPNGVEEDRCVAQIDTAESFLASIPAEIIANQAVECRSYARALLHWEQYIRKERSLIPSGRLMEKDELMYDRLQDIYSQIDEPDGLEGIAAHLTIISEEQQAFNHAKSGRWTAAQAWYELQLADRPEEIGLQQNVLRCMKETGQYAPLLKYANSFLDMATSTETEISAISVHLPLAVEACWMTDNLDGLQRRLEMQLPNGPIDFNIGIGRTLLRAANPADGHYLDEIISLRRSITESLSRADTDSLFVCHDAMLKLHVLYELEALLTADAVKAPSLLQLFDKRLSTVGSYIQDKQFILGIRRAVMRFRPQEFQENHSGALWLATARLARQARNTSSAYNAVLKAYECSDRGAKLEEARLLWHEGHQRKAIQSLQAAIDSGIFAEPGADPSVSTFALTDMNGYKQEILTAKALLILAKWLDTSGQSQSKDMTDRYQLAARRYQRWEKGHYYLGKHYSKLLNAEKALPKNKQAQSCLTGEMTKLVIDNSLRSIPFGNKYWHETIPRVLTLWLELGTETQKKAASEDQATFEKRAKNLQNCNKQLQKYFERVPPYVFYHTLPQLISRITHPHPDVWKQLCNILTRIASAYPSQALWSLLAVVKANDRTRVERGLEILTKLKDPKTKAKGTDVSGVDLRTIIQQGQRLCDGLLQACEAPVEPRAVQVSLSKNLKFNHNFAPSHLVVPIEATLTASSPNSTSQDGIRKHKAFAQDKITIQAFTDDVLVLNSLQRPRKITARGSDGKLYGLMCKPKDDLRKDQRLMEFNGLINRALKRNTESSKRRLYIKTYAVTPLSEESGLIEWVEGIKPTRDILLGIYARKSIRPNYNEIKKDLDVASSAPEHAHVFPERVLSQFPASLHEWFTETYAEPDTWFAARVRYARSAAVMSMAGHILGLGDRHGENILLEESTGGVFHVDFNCLFDKGLTFEKPELVPFRLTHNMVDAMGPYGYEGPFRKSCELTLSLLRQEHDTLMTVLETFLYDPTTDFVGKKKRSTAGVPDTPAEILESVATKLKGLLRGETVPLSVDGYVDALIQEATSHFRLASMYIGWCSFL